MKHLKCIFPKLYEWKIAFINMDVNTVLIIIEKKQQNLRYFNLIFLFKLKYPLWHHRILHCGIEN